MFQLFLIFLLLQCVSADPRCPDGFTPFENTQSCYKVSRIWGRSPWFHSFRPITKPEPTLEHIKHARKPAESSATYPPFTLLLKTSSSGNCTRRTQTSGWACSTVTVCGCGEEVAHLWPISNGREGCHWTRSTSRMLSWMWALIDGGMWRKLKSLGLSAKFGWRFEVTCWIKLLNSCVSILFQCINQYPSSNEKIYRDFIWERWLECHS